MKWLDTGESGKTKGVLQNRKILQHTRSEISSCSRKLAPLFELLATSCRGGTGKAAEMPQLARLAARFTFHSQRPGTSYELPFSVPELTKPANLCPFAAMFHFRFLSFCFLLCVPLKIRWDALLISRNLRITHNLFVSSRVFEKLTEEK